MGKSWVRANDRAITLCHFEDVPVLGVQSTSGNVVLGVGRGYKQSGGIIANFTLSKQQICKHQIQDDPNFEGSKSPPGYNCSRLNSVLHPDNIESYMKIVTLCLCFLSLIQELRNNSMTDDGWTSN